MAASLAAPAVAQSPYLKERAEKGDPQAQFEYAMQLNQAVPAQLEEARMWNQKAADAGVPGAIFWLGYAGWGKDKTVDYMRKAADLGYPAAVRTVMASLLNAGERTDVVAAKMYADYARTHDIALDKYQTEFLSVIDACNRAGPANMPSLHRPHTVGMEEYHRIEDVANGRGGPRDPRKALALLCQDSFMAQAEMKNFVAVLEAAMAAPPAKEFTFCDYITSGLHMNMCAGEFEIKRTAEQKKEIEALSALWTADQKAALARLQGAADTYFDTHTQFEISHLGTAHGAVSTEIRLTLRGAMVDSLKGFEAGRMPPPDDFAKADGELNTAYRALLARKEWEAMLDVSPSQKGVRETERIWIVYRDAWAALGAARYPQTSAGDWKAWVTRERTKELGEVGKYLDFSH